MRRRESDQQAERMEVGRIVGTRECAGHWISGRNTKIGNDFRGDELKSGPHSGRRHQRPGRVRLARVTHVPAAIIWRAQPGTCVVGLEAAVHRRRGGSELRERTDRDRRDDDQRPGDDAEPRATLHGLNSALGRATAQALYSGGAPRRLSLVRAPRHDRVPRSAVLLGRMRPTRPHHHAVNSDERRLSDLSLRRSVPPSQ